MATQGVAVASALISGPSRMLNYAAAGTAMVLGAEIGLRAVLTITHMFQNQNFPQDYQFREQSNFARDYVDFRQLTRNLGAKELVKTFVIATIAAAALTQLNFQLFGAPIKGINMFGRLIGVQVSESGILANINFSDWTEFFHQTVGQ